MIKAGHMQGLPPRLCGLCAFGPHQRNAQRLTVFRHHRSLKKCLCRLPCSCTPCSTSTCPPKMYTLWSTAAATGRGASGFRCWQDAGAPPQGAVWLLGLTEAPSRQAAHAALTLTPHPCAKTGQLGGLNVTWCNRASMLHARWPQCYVWCNQASMLHDAAGPQCYMPGGLNVTCQVASMLHARWPQCYMPGGLNVTYDATGCPAVCPGMTQPGALWCCSFRFPGGARLHRAWVQALADCDPALRKCKGFLALCARASRRRADRLPAVFPVGLCPCL